jgi:hypothetical protein
MNIELTDEERQVLRDALEGYLSDLRQEIVKTEKHEWLEALHREEKILRGVLARLA